MNQEREHKYFYLNRPPHYAHQPDGFTRWGKDHDEAMMSRYQMSDGGTIIAFGWVMYPQPLPFDKVWKFDLLPDDPLELAHYHFWNRAGRDEESGLEWEDDYVTTYLNYGEDALRVDADEMRYIKTLADERKRAQGGAA